MSPPLLTGFTVTHEPNGRFVLQDSDTRERTIDIRSGLSHGLAMTYQSGDRAKEARDPPLPDAQHRTRVRCCFKFELCFSIVESIGRLYARIKRWLRLTSPAATPPTPPLATTTAGG